MALNKPQPGVIQLGGSTVSLTEVARLLREIASRDDLMILTLTRTWARDYWMYVLTLPKVPGGWPPYYKVEIDGGRLVIRFSNKKMAGYRSVARRTSSAQITIPTKLIRQFGDVEPGPVLAELVSDNTIIVYF